MMMKKLDDMLKLREMRLTFATPAARKATNKTSEVMETAPPLK